MSTPQFGRQESGWEYRPRPGAYALIKDESRQLLVIRTLTGNYGLPGGGIDEGETPEQALRREMLEETGHEIVVLEEICRANQFVIAYTAFRAINKLGVFYAARLGRQVATPTEPDHFVEWMAVDEAAVRLAEESQRWAVAQALQRKAST